MVTEVIKVGDFNINAFEDIFFTNIDGTRFRLLDTEKDLRIHLRCCNYNLDCIGKLIKIIEKIRNIEIADSRINALLFILTTNSGREIQLSPGIFIRVLQNCCNQGGKGCETSSQPYIPKSCQLRQCYPNNKDKCSSEDILNIVESVFKQFEDIDPFRFIKVLKVRRFTPKTILRAINLAMDIFPQFSFIDIEQYAEVLKELKIFNIQTIFSLIESQFKDQTISDFVDALLVSQFSCNQIIMAIDKSKILASFSKEEYIAALLKGGCLLNECGENIADTLLRKYNLSVFEFIDLLEDLYDRNTMIKYILTKFFSSGFKEQDDAIEFGQALKALSCSCGDVQIILLDACLFPKLLPIKEVMAILRGAGCTCNDQILMLKDIFFQNIYQILDMIFNNSCLGCSDCYEVAEVLNKHFSETFFFCCDKFLVIVFREKKDFTIYDAKSGLIYANGSFESLLDAVQSLRSNNFSYTEITCFIRNLLGVILPNAQVTYNQFALALLKVKASYDVIVKQLTELKISQIEIDEALDSIDCAKDIFKESPFISCFSIFQQFKELFTPLTGQNISFMNQEFVFHTTTQNIDDNLILDLSLNNGILQKFFQVNYKKPHITSETPGLRNIIFPFPTTCLLSDWGNLRITIQLPVLLLNCSKLLIDKPLILSLKDLDTGYTQFFRFLEG